MLSFKLGSCSESVSQKRLSIGFLSLEEYPLHGAWQSFGIRYNISLCSALVHSSNSMAVMTAVSHPLDAPCWSWATLGGGTWDPQPTSICWICKDNPDTNFLTVVKFLKPWRQLWWCGLETVLRIPHGRVAAISGCSSAFYMFQASSMLCLSSEICPFMICPLKSQLSPCFLKSVSKDREQMWFLVLFPKVQNFD